MLAKTRFTFSKNATLIGPRDDGLIDDEQYEKMGAVAGNKENVQYGKAIINEKLSKNVFSAVAAVFARIAYNYDTTPFAAECFVVGINGRDWIRASHKAMLLAGAKDHEAKEAVNELYDMNRRTDPIRMRFQ